MCGTVTQKWSDLFPVMAAFSTISAAGVRKFAIFRFVVPVGVVAHATALELKETESMIHAEESQPLYLWPL